MSSTLPGTTRGDEEGEAEQAAASGAGRAARDPDSSTHKSHGSTGSANRSAGRPSGRPDDPRMPSDVSERVSLFDRFATAASDFASRAWFFALCLLLVLVWLPSYFLFQSVDTWQLIINTATTIVTFLLVALLQNTQTRSDEAVQHKLNAIAGGLADLMNRLAETTNHDGLCADMRELRKAVGLEEKESS
jgi:hypothetical protein